MSKKQAQEVAEYVSDSIDKMVVKIGVVGDKEEHWKAVQKVLDEQEAGIFIELIQFDDYVSPNEALKNGEIDLNAFQHRDYLNKAIDSGGYDFTVIGDLLLNK